MALRSANINVMVNAARKAAGRLKRDYGEVEQLQVSAKGTSDFVTAADIRTEKILKQELSKARPDYGFLMEEGGASGPANAERRWIVDPLDGTTNFIHGLAHFAISIGLEQKGEVIAGVIYAPILEEMFWAEKGQGAHLNDRRLRVSARRNMEESIFATGIPFKGKGGHDAFLAQMKAVMDVTAGIRRFGAASLDLAYVAAGRYEGFWESGLQPWDLAAGIVLMREAGGLVTDMTGGANMLGTGSVIAANDHLHGELSKLVAKAK